MTSSHICTPDYQNGVCRTCGEPAYYRAPTLELRLIDAIEAVASLMEFPGPLSERDSHEYARRLRRAVEDAE